MRRWPLPRCGGAGPTRSRSASASASRRAARELVLAWGGGGRRWWLSRAGVAYLAREQRPGMAMVIAPEPALTIQEDPMAPALDPELVSLAVNLSGVFPSVGALVFDRIHFLV